MKRHGIQSLLNSPSSPWEAYNAVRQGDELALTGAWLEHLVKHAGIHPVRARNSLEKAVAFKYPAPVLRGFHAGKTRYPDRKFYMFAKQDNEVVLRTVNFYYGDFLMPGRAAGTLSLHKSKVMRLLA